MARAPGGPRAPGGSPRHFHRHHLPFACVFDGPGVCLVAIPGLSHFPLYLYDSYSTLACVQAYVFYTIACG